MKNLLKFGLMVMALCLTQISFAQRGHGKGKMELLKSIVELTAEQETKIEAINKKYKAEKETLRGENDRTKIRELREKQRAEVEAILTTEQKAKLEAAHAQRKAEHKAMRENFDKEGLKAEMKAYKAENVEPVMRAQRRKLETKISAADKRKLADLRTKLADLKAERKEEFKNKENRPSREERQQSREAYKEKYKAELAQMKTLVEKYDADITALQKEIEPKAEQWKKDMRDIKKSYVEKAGGEHHKKGHREGGKHKAGEGKHTDMRKARFLLMDVNKPIVAPVATANLNLVKIFPNPAANTSTLTYELKKRDNISVELRDQSGTVLKTLVNEVKEAGTYTVEADLSAYKDGVYYYVLKDSTGMTTNKVVIAKQ